MSDSFATLWTVICQAPLSIGFSRQEYWSRLPFPFSGVFLTQGSNLHLLDWQEDYLQLSHYSKHAAAAAAKSLQLCPTLCNPIDGSPSGSPIPGILQARILEWVAISFSSDVFWPSVISGRAPFNPSAWAMGPVPLCCHLPQAVPAGGPQAVKNLRKYHPHIPLGLALGLSLDEDLSPECSNNFQTWAAFPNLSGQNNRGNYKNGME